MYYGMFIAEVKKIKSFILRSRCSIAYFQIYKCITEYVFHNRLENPKICGEHPHVEAKHAHQILHHNRPKVKHSLIFVGVMPRRWLREVCCVTEGSNGITWDCQLRQGGHIETFGGREWWDSLRIILSTQ